MGSTVIRRLNTGWLESEPATSLMSGGKHPDVPGGQIKSYGWQDDIRRADGSTVSGTMVPAPAWYLESCGKRILIDTGTGDADEIIRVQQRYGINLANRTHPDDHILAHLDRMSVEPGEIDIVIHTHLHFDHVGGDDLFPNAAFLVHQAELPWALCPPPYGVYYYREFGRRVRDALDQITIFSGDYQVTPDVRVVFTGGHSPGHCVVFVDTPAGRAVIAGDAVYNYRNLEYEWPQGPLFDVAATLRSMHVLKTADIILLNHDPIFEELFPGEVIGGESIPKATASYMLRLRTATAFPLRGYTENSPVGSTVVV
jgi:glyoxylase-like metal-dependent hydrolase (beta-lactamase superfamily II)